MELISSQDERRVPFATESLHSAEIVAKCLWIRHIYALKKNKNKTRRISEEAAGYIEHFRIRLACLLFPLPLRLVFAQATPGLGSCVRRSLGVAGERIEKPSGAKENPSFAKTIARPKQNDKKMGPQPSLG